jgi:hypothetical protein
MFTVNLNPDDVSTRWFKYDRDDLCVNKSQFVPVIFEPPCMFVRTRYFVSTPGFESRLRDPHLLLALWVISWS